MEKTLLELDLTGEFAVYHDTVFSTKGTFDFKGIVKTCNEIQNSNLKRNEKDLLFLYLINWWVFISHADWGLLKSKARLQKELARLQRLQKKSKEQDKEIEELKKKISELK